MAPTQEYVKRIHQALHPRWDYTGGWILAEVSDDSPMTVTLLGYKDPDPQEREIFISKVKASVDSYNPKIYWKRIGTSNLVELLSLEEVGDNEAKKDIQGLAKFVEDTRKKATEDIETVRVSFEYIQRQTYQLLERTNQGVGQAVQEVGQLVEPLGQTVTEAQRQAYQLLERAVQGVGQLVEPLEQIVTEAWNGYWLEQILEIITSALNLDNARNVVRKLQQDYRQEHASQIVERLIHEKTIFSTAVGLDSEAVTLLNGGLASGATLTLDLLNTTSLLAEMCYQIAVGYGVEDLEYPARKGEIIAILGLAFGSEQLQRLGLGFLLEHTPIPNAKLNAGTNVIMFQVVGYAACKFYSAKGKEKVNSLVSTDKFTEIETEVKLYLEAAISQEETIEKIVAEAVRIKKQLAI